MGNEDSEQGEGKGQSSRARQRWLPIHDPQEVRQRGARGRKLAATKETPLEDREEVGDQNLALEIAKHPPRSPGCLITSGVIWLAALGWFVFRLAAYGSGAACAMTLFGLSALFLVVGAAALVLAIHRRRRDIATLYKAGRQLASDLGSRRRSTLTPRRLKSLEELRRIERALRDSRANREAADLAQHLESLDEHRERIGS